MLNTIIGALLPIVVVLLLGFFSGWHDRQLLHRFADCAFRVPPRSRHEQFTSAYDWRTGREAVITMAVPAASLAVILAVQFKTAEQEMASSLLFSTVLSIPTMGLFMFLTH